MNRNITLAKRENEIAECVAWGGSYKETASLLQISVRTVDNTLRRIKEKLGLNKINECTFVALILKLCCKYIEHFYISNEKMKKISLLMEKCSKMV